MGHSNRSAKFPKLGLDQTWHMILTSRKAIIPSPQPPKQNNQKSGNPSVTTTAAPCTPPKGISWQLMQDTVAQPVVSMVASSSSNSPAFGGRRGQPTIMTISFICEQIDIGLNDIMLELSKQLADIVKLMVHNEIQVAQ